MDSTRLLLPAWLYECCVVSYLDHPVAPAFVFHHLPKLQFQNGMKDNSAAAQQPADNLNGVTALMRFHCGHNPTGLGEHR